jgi:MFS family permease
MKMPQPTRKNPDGSMQDHNLLDRLQQDGAERFPDHHFSFMGVNRLNLALFLSYGFTSAASSVPIALIPTIAMDVLSYDNEDGEDGQYLEATASIFASTVATYAVLGTAFGKFLNGPLGDICGARRVACLYALMLSISLMILSFGYSSVAIIACCAAVEFFQSVQWPCIAVILAAVSSAM